jgi:hypothetical protein
MALFPWDVRLGEHWSGTQLYESCCFIYQFIGRVSRREHSFILSGFIRRVHEINRTPYKAGGTTALGYREFGWKIRPQPGPIIKKG